MYAYVCVCHSVSLLYCGSPFAFVRLSLCVSRSLSLRLYIYMYTTIYVSSYLPLSLSVQVCALLDRMMIPSAHSEQRSQIEPPGLCAAACAAHRCAAAVP